MFGYAQPLGQAAQPVPAAPPQGGMSPEQVRMALAQKFGQPQQPLPIPTLPGVAPAQPMGQPMAEQPPPVPAPMTPTAPPPTGMPELPANSKPYLPTGGAVPPSQAGAPMLNKAGNVGAGVSKAYPVNQPPI